MPNRIRDLRDDSDLTQQQLADILGMTQRKYSYIETGVQPATEDFLNKLANFYETSVDYILMRTDERTPYPKRKPFSPG